jgi:hypothetical protein
MSLKRPRSGLTGSSFQSHLIYFDRCANTHLDWTSYIKLMPPEAEEYSIWIVKLKLALEQNRYRTPAHRYKLETLLQRYRSDLAMLSRDFWETHALYFIK